MIDRLIPRIGFAWSMRTAAFMILGLMIIANLTVKSRLEPRPSPLVIMEFIRPLKEPPFLFTALASFLFFFGTFLPFNFIILQAQEQGMSARLANYLLAILNAARYSLIPFSPPNAIFQAMLTTL